MHSDNTGSPTRATAGVSKIQRKSDAGVVPMTTPDVLASCLFHMVAVLEMENDN